MRRFIPFAIPSGSSPAVKTQTKSATITANGGSVTVQPDSGYLLSSATVTANIPTEEKTLTVTENGNYTITPTAGKLMSKASVSVNVPTGGGLAEGQTAVHDIPGGKILSAQVSVASTTTNNKITATITLPDSLSGVLPDYIVAVMNNHSKTNTQSYAFSFIAKVNGEYGCYGGLCWDSTSRAWSSLTSIVQAPVASVNGTTLTIKAGPRTYTIAAGVLTFYAIWVSDDA